MRFFASPRHTSRPNVRRILLSAFLFLLVGSLRPAQTVREDGRMSGDLIFTDPFADPTLLKLCRDRSRVESAFKSSLGNGVSQLGSDTNYVLLGAVSQPPSNSVRAQTLFYSRATAWRTTGRRATRRLQRVGGRRRSASLPAFHCQERGISGPSFESNFRTCPFTGLGNEDAYCGDYEYNLRPVLRMFAQAWLTCLGRCGQRRVHG